MNDETVKADVERLATMETLTMLRDEICKIKHPYEIKSWDDYMGENTCGFHVAFGIACMDTSNDELFKYPTCVPWGNGFDDGPNPDAFDYILIDLMKQNNIHPRKIEAKSDYYINCLNKVEEYKKKLGV